MHPIQSQSTAKILMIRPIGFKANVETLDDNYFQQANDRAAEVIERDALAEFDSMVEQLMSNGVEVVVLNPLRAELTPDAVFPNNWFSLDHQGTLFIYPMANVSRRHEVRPHFQDELQSLGVKVNKVVDWSPFAEQFKFLEGTGSLVLDHMQKVAYMARSNRSDERLAMEWALVMDYRLLCFDTCPNKFGQNVYHTNVMLTIFTELVIVCVDIIEPAHRTFVMESLKSSGKIILEISIDQMFGFVGNMLEVRNKKKHVFFLISQQAANALKNEQQKALEQYGDLIINNIDTIEKYGGGGVRCMVAELFGD